MYFFGEEVLLDNMQKILIKILRNKYRNKFFRVGGWIKGQMFLICFSLQYYYNKKDIRDIKVVEEIYILKLIDFKKSCFWINYLILIFNGMEIDWNFLKGGGGWILC